MQLMLNTMMKLPFSMSKKSMFGNVEINKNADTNNIEVGHREEKKKKIAANDIKGECQNSTLVISFWFIKIRACKSYKIVRILQYRDHQSYVRVLLQSEDN